MKAPNGDLCAISWDRERALDVVIRILRRSRPELVKAYEEKETIFFSLAPSEERMLCKHVKEGGCVAEKLRRFLNEALGYTAMPYRFRRGLGEVNGHMYAFKVAKL